MRRCERCERSVDPWRVERAEFRVHEIHLLPVLCDLCAAQVEMLVRAALKCESAASKEGATND